MSTTAAKLMTADEFWNSPLNGKGVELVRGQVVLQGQVLTRDQVGEPAMPTSVDHGEIAINIGMLLKLWSRQHDGGWVGTETGFVLSTEPDTVRGPDVAFVSAKRIPAEGRPSPFWRQPPDLAVEVVSPSDSAQLVFDKAAEYLKAGTAEVWLVFPISRQIQIRRPDGLDQTLSEDQDLTSPVLPGFSCRVSELFSQ